MAVLHISEVLVPVDRCGCINPGSETYGEYFLPLTETRVPVNAEGVWYQDLTKLVGDFVPLEGGKLESIFT